MRAIHSLIRLSEGAFYRAVNSTGISCTLKESAATITPLTYAAVVGDSPRTETSYCIPCLYNTRFFGALDRDKHGIVQDKSMEIYLTPKHLEERRGSFELNQRTLSVNINGQEYLVTKVEYLGAATFSTIPINRCVAVKLTLAYGEDGGQ